MGTRLLRRLGWLSPAIAGIAVVIAVFLAGQVSGNAASVPISISISGNHFVNGAGQTIRLLGVDHASLEYACEEGFGYGDGHLDDADAVAIASWGANVVRVPLNEDCWLGINGQPNTSQGEALTQVGYQQAVEQYVAALNAHGLYAILDLHWSAPGSEPADGQQPMPDDHSAAFWTSVASTFKANPAVVFDVFNEPFSPADPRSGDDPNPAHSVTWVCWENGGCVIPAYQGTDTRTATLYPAVGMQALVSAIRATGATQPIMVGGLDYANDLTQWAANAPDDPLDQEAASFHNYQGKSCDNAACWNSTIAAVAASVPVVTGEFDEDDFDNASCANKTPSTFDSDYMNWADQHGVGYLAWGWEVLSAQEISDQGCSAFYLTSGPSGTPAAPNGTALHDHLATLTAPGTGAPNPGTTVPTPTTPTPTNGGNGGGSLHPVKLASFTAVVGSGGSTVVIRLRTAVSCKGTLSGETTSTFAVKVKGKKRRERVPLGSTRFSLSAGKSKAVVLRLSKLSHTILTRTHALKVRITVTLGSSATRSVTHHTEALKLPTPRRRKG